MPPNSLSAYPTTSLQAELNRRRVKEESKNKQEYAQNCKKAAKVLKPLWDELQRLRKIEWTSPEGDHYSFVLELEYGSDYLEFYVGDVKIKPKSFWGKFIKNERIFDEGGWAELFEALPRSVTKRFDTVLTELRHQLYNFDGDVVESVLFA